MTAGEWLAAEGGWVRDKEHGLQFIAEGIERHLGSALVKGIAPILAKKLDGRFAVELLAVIEKRAAG